MKKYKGIIFDFNGTIFLDSPLHEKAWMEFAAEELGKTITKEQYYQNIHGRSNPMIYEFLYGKPLLPEQAAAFGQGKEKKYRALCRKQQDTLQLAKGSLALFDFLNRHKIPHAIATSSEISNVTFFKTLFDLEGWFGDNIIYDDGKIKGKPAPDLYLKAGEKLNLKMEDIIVVEDANSGLIAAKRAKAGLVVGIAPYGKEQFVGRENADLIIRDFTMLDRNLFLEISV